MKLQLTVNSGTLTGRMFELENGFLTIGRGENCSIRFDPTSERIASKQHAFIEAKPDGYYLTDNQSTNGTILNGTRVQTAQLNSGDIIQFGRNGVTANVLIHHAAAQHVPPPEQFRQEQISQFNQLSQRVPDNVQNSMSNIGLGNIATASPEPSKTKMYIGAGVTIIALVFLCMIVGLIMFASLGVVPAIIGALVAFTPAILYLLPLIWLDRYDPEPFWLLSLAYAWGALVAVLVSFVLNTVFGISVAVTVGGAGRRSAREHSRRRHLRAGRRGSLEGCRSSHIADLLPAPFR
jgi:pSer/pThr/pTyr-binding forkhead associated (FHA) protein